MDRFTKAAAIAALAKSAAEIAAEVAEQTCEAAAVEPSKTQTGRTGETCNLIVGTLIPAREGVERLRTILETIEVLHRTPEV